MLGRIATAAFLSLVLASPSGTQVPGPGLTWDGSSGSNAGSFIPSCANLPVKAVVGESVSVKVWGDPLAPFVLLASASGNQCLPLPGLGNALVLDPPILSVAVGVLNFVTPCLSCPSGFHDLTFTVPPAPSGVSASLQAVSVGAARPSFTVAITATIG